MLNDWLKNLDQDTRAKIENNETDAVLHDVNNFDDWWYNLDVERRIEMRDLCKIIMDYSDSVLRKRLHKR